MTTSNTQALYEFYNNNEAFPKYDNELKLWTMTNKKTIEYNESRVPIYKFIVEQEIIELHKLSEQIKQKGNTVFYYNTDNVCFTGGKSMKDLVKNSYWDDEKTVFQYKFEDKDPEQELVERMKNKKRDKLMRCKTTNGI